MGKKIIRYCVSVFIMLGFYSGVECYSQSQIFIQAEVADTISRGSIDNDDQGYTGTGFVNLENAFGTYVVWMIDFPASGQYTVSVRYANGSVDRTMNILVNNVLAVENLNFTSTGSWTKWKTIDFKLDFTLGKNNLKFVGSNPNSGPSLDCITISNPDVNLEAAPVALDDKIATSNTVTAFIEPLLNDYDRNGDELHIVSYTNPLNGTLSATQNNSAFYYKPEQDYVGMDSFSYVLSDGKSEVSANVIIQVHEFDWSVEMANMIINTKSTQINWDYTVGLLLEGVLRVYKRTGDQRYLDFITQWAQYHVKADGTINVTLNSLDNIMPGFTLLHLYQETGIERFKLAADKLRKRFDTYPRTPDGCFWHMTDLKGELWLDGLYMGMPFLVNYGKMFNDENYAYSEAILQFKKHIDYLMDNETGLLLHAYDYDGSESWALPPYKRSPYAWGRAMGWVVMGLTEILDIIPEDFPERDIIVEQYKTVLKSLAKYQDPETGLWYQVVDHQNDTGNWLETSCSMMFIYSMSRAIQKGFLDESYSTNVDLGYSGVLTKISEGKDKMVYLTDISEGTSVSADIQYYFDRAKSTNDNHGLGTFLIMNELIGYNNLPWLSTKVEELQTRDISIYPNPCGDYAELRIDNSDQNTTIEIFNISGMKVKTILSSNQSGPVRLDMSESPRGIYLIRVHSNGQSYTKKLIRQ